MMIIHLRTSLLSLLLVVGLSLPMAARISPEGDAVERKIEMLKIQASYDIDRVMQQSALQANQIRSQWSDTLMVILGEGETRMLALKQEAAEAISDLRRKALSNPINRHLRGSHFERKMEALELKYEGLYDLLKEEYQHKADAVVVQFEKQGLALEKQVEIQIRQIEAECEKKIAMLLLEE